MIVATRVSQQANDKCELKPLIEELKNTTSMALSRRRSVPTAATLARITSPILPKKKIDAYVATGRLKHTDRLLPAPKGRIPKGATIKERMARKLRTIKGRMIYAKRKEISEPVFGQIKEVRGFRQFLLRGIAKVDCEVGHHLPWPQSPEALQKHFETSNSLSLSLSDPLTRAVVSSIGPILVWSKSPESVPLSTFFNFQRTVYRLYKIIRSSPKTPRPSRWMRGRWF